MRRIMSNINLSIKIKIKGKKFANSIEDMEETL